jgi:hypothetical protein
MSNAVFIPLALTLIAYVGYHWSALTTVMIDEARHQRVKRHIDWTAVRRSGLSKTVGWRLW